MQMGLITADDAVTLWQYSASGLHESPATVLASLRVGNLLMAMKVSLTGVLFDAGSEWYLVSSIGPKLKKGALPGVRV